MKYFTAAALFAAISMAAEEDEGKWRYSKPTDDASGYDGSWTSQRLIDSGDIVWDMKVSTAFEEDSGNTYLRFKHELTANILPTDEVTFEVAFTVDDDPWSNKMEMADDLAVCNLVQST